MPTRASTDLGPRLPGCVRERDSAWGAWRRRSGSEPTARRITPSLIVFGQQHDAAFPRQADAGLVPHRDILVRRGTDCQLDRTATDLEDEPAGGLVVISVRDPIWRITPPSMTAIRSEIASDSSWSWVT